tara:strand:- start:132 stop:737 length:606 start_codon:yes stop_codon:yes gene_type:complete
MNSRPGPINLRDRGWGVPEYVPSQPGYQGECLPSQPGYQGEPAGHKSQPGRQPAPLQQKTGMFWARHDPCELTKADEAELREQARKLVKARKGTRDVGACALDWTYEELARQKKEKLRRNINELTGEEVDEYLERHRWHTFYTQKEADDYLRSVTVYDNPFPGGIGLDAQKRFDDKRKSVEDKDYYSKYHVLGRYVGGFKN